MTFFKLVAKTTPGLEWLFYQELISLGKKNAKLFSKNGKFLVHKPHPDSNGLLHVQTSQEGLWGVFHYSRLVESLQIGVGQKFRCGGIKELAKAVTTMPFNDFFLPNTIPIVQVKCKKSRLYHTRALSKRLTHYIQQHLQEESDQDFVTHFRNKKKKKRSFLTAAAKVDIAKSKSKLLSSVHLNIIRNWATFRISMHSDPLYKRGWRQHVANEALKETFAAACVQVAEPYIITRSHPDDWTCTSCMIQNPAKYSRFCFKCKAKKSNIDNKVILDQSTNTREIQILWDPFCGSGTILIEWIARINCLPSISPTEHFSFKDWNIHNHSLYAECLDIMNQKKSFDMNAHPVLQEYKNVDNELRNQIFQKNQIEHETLRVIGSDINIKNIHASQHNAKLADISQFSNFLQGDFSKIANQIPKNTAIITNIPYGIRSGNKNAHNDLQRNQKGSKIQNYLNKNQDKRDIAQLYRKFASLLRRRKDLNPVFVLTVDTDHRGKHTNNDISDSSYFEAVSGLEWESLLSFSNNSIPVKLIKLKR